MNAFLIATYIGLTAFAISGFLTGVRKNLDMMGVFIVTMMTSTGGGIARDLLVGRRPEFLQDVKVFVWILLVCVLCLMLRVYRFQGLERRRFFVLSNALGLVAFSLTGALVAVDAGLTFVGVIVLAFVTASGGGILRDVIVNDVPQIFSSDFYGTVAILVGIAVYWLNEFELLNDWSVVGVFVGALILRLIAYFYGWQFPRMKMDDPS